MPSFLRGEEMELVQLIIPKETAYECVGELGRIGVVQFNDVSFCFRFVGIGVLSRSPAVAPFS